MTVRGNLRRRWNWSNRNKNVHKILILMSQHAKSLLLFIALFVSILMTGCAKNDGALSLGEDDRLFLTPGNGQVKVTFFDVGKGDAILIETSGHCMLIDSGYDDTSESLLDYIDQQNIGRLDYMILTHFDKDHVGGADRIIENVEIGTVLQPDYESDSGQYQEYVQAMESKGIVPVRVMNQMEMSLDGVDFLLDPPKQNDYEQENDFSLVISMTCGEVSFLFAGDCEKERLDELLEQTGFGLAHDVLKVPHHGRKEKNSEEFLKAVSPATAVITHSPKEAEDGKVYRTLDEMETEVYFTGNGTVTCLCDGQKMQWQQ